MKATLTIEVPDDFKKGDKRCKYRYMYAEGRNACCDLVFCMECNADNCPLEIQGECEACKNIASALCSICSGGKTNYYERAKCPIELKVGNNQ